MNKIEERVEKLQKRLAVIETELGKIHGAGGDKKVKIFIVEAMDNSGKEAKVEIEAASEEEANKKVRAKGFLPISFKIKREGLFDPAKLKDPKLQKLLAEKQAIERELENLEDQIRALMMVQMIVDKVTKYLPVAEVMVEENAPEVGRILQLVGKAIIDEAEKFEPLVKRYHAFNARMLKDDMAALQKVGGLTKAQAFQIILAKIKPFDLNSVTMMMNSFSKNER